MLGENIEKAWLYPTDRVSSFFFKKKKVIPSAVVPLLHTKSNEWLWKDSQAGIKLQAGSRSETRGFGREKRKKKNTKRKWSLVRKRQCKHETEYQVAAKVQPLQVSIYSTEVEKAMKKYLKSKNQATGKKKTTKNLLSPPELSIWSFLHQPGMKSSLRIRQLPAIFPNLAQKFCDLWQWTFWKLWPQGEIETFKKVLQKHDTHLNSKKRKSVFSLKKI